MYCVRCGVRLQEGTEQCPLCQTPVWNPDQMVVSPSYPARMPLQSREKNWPLLIALSLLSAIAILTVLIVCLRLYGWLHWGVYAIGGIALFDLIVLLPGWFSHPRAEIFVPLDHLGVGLYLLWICLHTGGHWFLSFAFPLTMMSCALSTGLLCLLKYVRHGKPFILGGFFILLGGCTMLVELFEHITFGTEMFQWSLYTVGILGLAGLFLLLAGIIPPLRQAMRRFFFY